MFKSLAKSLGLPEDADEATVMAAVKAAQDSAAKASELEAEVETLKASQVPENVDLTKLQADAEAGVEAKETLRVNTRDALIAQAVRERKIDPADKEKYTKLYDSAPAEVTELVASLKEGKLGAIGHEGEGDPDAKLLAGLVSTGEALSGSKIPETVVIAGSEYPVDEDSAKLHVAALALLEESGKRLDFTEDDYAAACVAVASKQGIRL